MPNYSYQHPDGRIIDVFQSMNESHEVWVDEDKVEWKRIWEVPQKAIIDGIFSLDPRDSKGFVSATGKRRGKLGDVLSLSAEMSEKRTAKYGKDDIKIKSWESYESKRTKNTVHPDRKHQELVAALKKSKFDVEL